MAQPGRLRDETYFLIRDTASMQCFVQRKALVFDQRINRPQTTVGAHGRAPLLAPHLIQPKSPEGGRRLGAPIPEGYNPGCHTFQVSPII